MKAIVYNQYGSPDVLRLLEVSKPTPKDDEVLIKVHAASINSWDWDMVRGSPIFVRMWGLFRPKFPIPGADVAGVIEAVGKKVSGLKPGDAVFADLAGHGWGTFAEYVCAPESILAIKPDGVSFSQAAALPQAGALALQAVKDRAAVHQDQRVLINGAGGGVGTLAIQMAKSYGARITAVDCATKLGTLRTLGAEEVIDYQRVDFTKGRKQYDVIIDVTSNRSILAFRKVLTSGGMYIMLGGTTPAIFKAMLLGPLISGKQQLGILGYKPNKDLDVMASLCQDRKVQPVIDRTFSLNDTAEAFRYFATGKVIGKVIICP